MEGQDQAFKAMLEQNWYFNGLFPHQLASCQDTFQQAFHNGKHVLNVAPCASGKSRVICATVAGFAKRGKRALVLCPDEEVKLQLFKSMVETGIFKEGCKIVVVHSASGVDQLSDVGSLTQHTKFYRNEVAETEAAFAALQSVAPAGFPPPLHLFPRVLSAKRLTPDELRKELGGAEVVVATSINMLALMGVSGVPIAEDPLPFPDLHDLFDLIAVDEVHRAGSDSYQRIYECLLPRHRLGQSDSGPRIVGTSASPDRHDGKGIFPEYVPKEDVHTRDVISFNDAVELKLVRRQVIREISLTVTVLVDDDAKYQNIPSKYIADIIYGDVPKGMSTEKKTALKRAFRLAAKSDALKTLIYEAVVQETVRLRACAGEPQENAMFMLWAEDKEEAHLAKRVLVLLLRNTVSASGEAVLLCIGTESLPDDIATNPKYWGIVCCNRLVEGYDLPRVSVVAFSSPRRSRRVVVQASGRAARMTNLRLDTPWNERSTLPEKEFRFLVWPSWFPPCSAFGGDSAAGEGDEEEEGFSNGEIITSNASDDVDDSGSGDGEAADGKKRKGSPAPTVIVELVTNLVQMTASLPDNASLPVPDLLPMELELDRTGGVRDMIQLERERERTNKRQKAGDEVIMEERLQAIEKNVEKKMEKKLEAMMKKSMEEAVKIARQQGQHDERDSHREL
jgi:hypothetical protein